MWNAYDAHWGFGYRKCPGRHIGVQVLYKTLVMVCDLCGLYGLIMSVLWSSVIEILVQIRSYAISITKRGLQGRLPC